MNQEKETDKTYQDFYDIILKTMHFSFKASIVKVHQKLIKFFFKESELINLPTWLKFYCTGPPSAVYSYLCLWWCLWRPCDRRWWSLWCLWCLWRWLWLWPPLLGIGISKLSSMDSDFSWSPWLPLLWRLLILPRLSYLESSGFKFIMLSNLSIFSTFSSSGFCCEDGTLFLASSSRILAFANTRL